MYFIYFTKIFQKLKKFKIELNSKLHINAFKSTK